MPKRGENIRKRKDGRWEGRYIKGYTTGGKAIYTSVYGRSYKEIRGKLLAERNEPATTGGREPVRGQATFYFAATLWLNSIQLRVKQQTYHKYKGVIQRHIAPVLGNIAVAEIDSDTINAFLQEKYNMGRLDGKEGLSASTVRTMAFILRAVLEYSVREGMRGSLPQNIARPMLVQKDLTVFTREEQERLEGYLRLDIYNPVKLSVFLCLYTGLRLGEICALKWADIHLEQSVLQVRAAVKRLPNAVEGETPKTRLILAEPKSVRSKRDIPLPGLALPYLRTARGMAQNEFLLPGSVYPFMDPRMLQYRFSAILRDCGLRPVNFHALRHTFATRCVEVGMDVKTLSEIMGHSNVGITLNTYVHSSMEQKRRQMDLLEDIWGQK